MERPVPGRFREIPYGGSRHDLPDHLSIPAWSNNPTSASDVMGRLVWEKPSVTIRTEFFKPEKGQLLHPTQHRAITHWEVAHLQGFPDDYRWVGPRADIARQIGNAVPLALGDAIGRLVADLLRRGTRAGVRRVHPCPRRPGYFEACQTIAHSAMRSSAVAAWRNLKVGR